MNGAVSGNSVDMAYVPVATASSHRWGCTR
jgi:hypothetical protein